MQLIKDFYLSFINRTTEKLCLLIEQLKELSVESNTIHKVDKVAQKSSIVIKISQEQLRLSLHPP